MTAPSGNVNCWSAPISLMTLYSLRGSLMPFALSASMFLSKIGATLSTSNAPGRSGSTTTKPTQGTVWAIGAALTVNALDRVSQVHAPSASLGIFLPSKTSPKAASDWPVAFGDTKGPRGGRNPGGGRCGTPTSSWMTCGAATRLCVSCSDARTYARRPSGPKISIGWSDASRSCPHKQSSPGRPKVWSPWRCVTNIASTLPGFTRVVRWACTCVASPASNK
mmetsp:Transcript_22571/g.58789  ORF Transcript_22571/g.58789 Transcript_22571/m.58789 type:complete len:222 (-) Transcript_22571:388-1053(-)